jgi:transcription elongation factor S-II
VPDVEIGVEKQGGAYKCGGCGGTNTTNYRLVTRSADEPMIVFVTCKDCGKKWKAKAAAGGGC